MVPMNEQITKDTKFKDLPESIKTRIIALAKPFEPLNAVHVHNINDFKVIDEKFNSLNLEELNSTFEQCVANCEAFREGNNAKPEEIYKNIDNELNEIEMKIQTFRDSMNDFDLLRYMYNTIQLLHKRFEKIKSEKE